MMDPGTALVGRLLESVPELALIYQQHIEDNDALLPHVFLGDVTRFAIDQTNNAEAQDPLNRLLETLEREISSGDPGVAELIAVSFVENLVGEDSALSKLVPLMGKALRDEVRAICGN